MDNNTYLINCTDPFDYLNSLEELGNRRLKLWNGYELAFNKYNVKTNCQIFIKDDLHFYRTDSSVADNIVLKVREEEVDQKYIDFRMNCFGSSSSIIMDKELQLQQAHGKEQSLHIFLKKEIAGLNEEILETKRKKAHLNPKIKNLSDQILSIPATGNNNALLIEGKLLELSYTFLNYLQTPVLTPPTFLSSDYNLNCLNDAKQILDKEYVNPPTIKTLSKRVGINSNQLKVGFKYLFGSTIRKYVINQRLEDAQDLILNTRIPLGTICKKVGYTNHGHFSSLYRKKFGRTPLSERIK